MKYSVIATALILYGSYCGLDALITHYHENRDDVNATKEIECLMSERERLGIKYTADKRNVEVMERCLING